MTSVKQPTSRNPPPRLFGPKDRRGALLKSTTQHHFGFGQTTDVVLSFFKKNYKLINL